MSKSSLIIDTPKYCYLCSCYAEYDDVGYCQGITVKRVPTKGKPSWCPLKPYKKVEAIPVEWIEKEIKRTTDITDEKELDILYAGNLSYMLKLWEKESADLR